MPTLDQARKLWTKNEVNKPEEMNKGQLEELKVSQMGGVTTRRFTGCVTSDHSYAAAARVDENKENEPPKNLQKPSITGKNLAPGKPEQRPQYREYAFEEQEELVLLAKRVIAPLTLHPKYKLFEERARRVNWGAIPCLDRFGSGCAKDLGAVYRKIMRGQYGSRDECLKEIALMWYAAWRGTEPSDPIRLLPVSLRWVFDKMLSLHVHERRKEVFGEVPVPGKSTWHSNPLDKPMLRAIGKNHCICCTNPVSA